MKLQITNGASGRRIAKTARWAACSSALSLCCASLPAIAQVQQVDTSAVDGPSAPDSQRMEEAIIVTATKRSDVSVQDVPVAITAFGERELERANFSSMSTLDNTVPNAQIGTSSSIPGNANLSIRGLGTNTNIASAEPTVGVFNDGIYVGLFYGNLTNTFDLEAVEILRGPQGVLFGKNVTGGAVILRTTRPADVLSANVFASVETGPEYAGSAVVSGPLAGDILKFKVAGYYSKDEGFFFDSAQNEPLGVQRTWIARAALEFEPSADLNVIARYEHGDNDGSTDPANQNMLVNNPDKFYIATSGQGFNFATWDQITVEANLDIGFGDGTVTNIAGWRWVDADGDFDIDALPALLFQGANAARQNQFSNELRYSGGFGNVDVLAGLYYFAQNFQALERRRLLNDALFLTGGGVQAQDTYGIFGTADWHLTDELTLSFGARYTIEKKDVKVAILAANNCVPQSVHRGDLDCNFDFFDDNTSKGFTPRIGLQWQPDPETLVYAYWAKGLRGGGYSFRNTVRGLDPGPYGDEVQYALEAGLKTDLADNALRLNVAIFRSVVQDLQRDRIFSDPGVGAASLTGNVGDAVYQGVEAEATVFVTPAFWLNGFVGIVDAHYTELNADLSGDGIVNQVDLNLDLVRAVPLTYGFGANFEQEIGAIGELAARVQYGFTDRQAYLDNNSAFLNARKALEASVALTTWEDRLTLSVYGRNLLNERMTAASVPLPAAFGGGYETVMEGRVIGTSARFRF